MQTKKPTAEQIAKVFGVTVEQVRTLAKKNSAQSAECAKKAEKTGVYRGIKHADWVESAKHMAAL
jgi:ribosomal protein L23